VDNPICTIFKIIDTLLGTNDPNEESDNCTSSQGDTERNETGSEKLPSNIPSEWEWI